MYPCYFSYDLALAGEEGGCGDFCWLDIFNNYCTHCMLGRKKVASFKLGVCQSRAEPADDRNSEV